MHRQGQEASLQCISRRQRETDFPPGAQCTSKVAPWTHQKSWNVEQKLTFSLATFGSLQWKDGKQHGSRAGARQAVSVRRGTSISGDDE